MSVALVAQINTKISFFLYANFFLFCRHKQKNFSGSIAPTSAGALPWMDFGTYSAPPDAQLYTRALCALLSVHLNN